MWEATGKGVRQGDLLPILSRLSPKVDVVVSGHTHAAYICELTKAGRTRPLLLTSAGRYGTLITDLRLTVDPVAVPRFRPGSMASTIAAWQSRNDAS